MLEVKNLKQTEKYFSWVKYSPITRLMDKQIFFFNLFRVYVVIVSVNQALWEGKSVRGSIFGYNEEGRRRSLI